MCLIVKRNLRIKLTVGIKENSKKDINTQLAKEFIKKSLQIDIKWFQRSIISRRLIQKHNKQMQSIKKQPSTFIKVV